jgi:transcriptional regulator with XRE-family HTH domain
MGLIAPDLPADAYCASGASAFSVDPPAVHWVLAEEEMLKQAFALYQASGGVVATLLSNTPSGSSTKIDIEAKNNLASVVDEICSAFGLTKEELAQVCKVQSRKTLYNWINGEVKPRKAAMNRIYDLLLSARAWRKTGFSVVLGQLHVPVLSGQSVFDLLSEEQIDRDRILFAGSRLSMLSSKSDNFVDPFA